jgi:hypothetical protein
LKCTSSISIAFGEFVGSRGVANMRLNLGCSARQMLVLAPSGTRSCPELGRTEGDPARYERILGNMQRLRGRIYLNDGAIEPSDLTADGRHRQAADALSWHLLSVDSSDRVYACARYRVYSEPVAFHQLGVSSSEAAKSDIWGTLLEDAVEREISLARALGVAFVEVGGWALAEELRHTTEALKIALSMYSLSQLTGGCIGLTTATMRHSSAPILRKIGGRRLDLGGCDLPRYYDSRYKCEMEILRFDSARPDARFRDRVEDLKSDLVNIQVVCDNREVVREAAARQQEMGRFKAPLHALPSVA